MSYVFRLALLSSYALLLLIVALSSNALQFTVSIGLFVAFEYFVGRNVRRYLRG